MVPLALFCLRALKLCGHTFIDLTYKRTGFEVRTGLHLGMATTSCLQGNTRKAATARINTAVNTDGALSSSAMAVIALEGNRGVRRRADGRGSAALWRRKGLERNACKAETWVMGGGQEDVDVKTMYSGASDGHYQP
ncbi:hypothetical protein KC335_g38 [Hortaea werneckii]|nr:hypothetical protein KC335_g38 [Hortaea werneckii]